MKKNNLQKAIKIKLIFLVILLIVLSFMIGKKINDSDNYSSIPSYATLEEIPDVESLINELYGKCEKIVDSSHEKYYKDIYVNLKYGLYEGETAQKNFFENLISTVAEKMYYQNVRVIDEEKEIEVKIVCDNVNQELIGSYINGDMNFFGHYESQKALSNYKKTEITNFNIESNEIITLMQNEWDKDKLNIGKSSKDAEGYYEYSEYGINIYEIDEKVFNLLFDYRYEGNVANGIKVGDTLESVINILGEPTFGSLDEDYIGYKGEKFYLFFNSEQISLYPVEDKVSDLSSLIKQYEEDGSIKKMISNATDIWENYYEYYYDEYTVDLSYPLQGIKFEFGLTDNNGIIIYSNFIGRILENYTLEELTDLEIEIPSYIYFVEEDSVNEYERERAYFVTTSVEGGDYQEVGEDKYL